jgi:glutathione peroxidase
VDFYDLEARAIDGTQVRMDAYRGLATLVVNVASRCAYTPQYRGLEALYRSWRARGVVVLGFPCDQFGGQEPGSDKEVARFCRDRFDVTFPLFSKVKVNGPDAHPVFRHLKPRARGVLGTATIKWNFTKFLISPDGASVRRFAPSVPPAAIEQALERLLDA